MSTSVSVAGSIPAYNRRQRVTIVALAFSCTVLDGADFTVFLYFMAPLAAHLHVSLVELSSIQASSYLIGIVGGIVFGRFADRRGRRAGLFVTVLLFSIFTSVTAVVNSYEMLFLVRVLAGIGIGGESGIAFAYVNEAFPGKEQRRGLASGLLQSMFLAGALLAAWIYRGTAGLGEDAWRWAFGTLGAIGLICAVATLFMPESQLWRERMQMRPTAGAMGAKPVSMRQLLSGPLGKRMLIASALLSASFYGSYAVYTYGPAMWQSVYHLNARQVGNIGIVSSVLGAISYITGGFLADAIGRRRAYLVTTALGVLAYVVFGAALYVTSGDMVAPRTFWIMLSAYFLLHMGYGYFGVQGVWLSELFPTEVRTTAQNAVYYIGRAIGAGGAPILGLLIARGLGWSVAEAVAFGAVGAIAAAMLCRLLPETRGQELQN